MTLSEVEERWVACEMALAIYEAVTGKPWDQDQGPEDSAFWVTVGEAALTAHKLAVDAITWNRAHGRSFAASGGWSGSPVAGTGGTAE